MRDLGHGAGYVYDHDTEDGISGQSYFPERLEHETFYEPVERGFERELRKRREWFDRRRRR